ncbi:T9SS type A sorting domain-containing protein [Mucilaginibacter sp.]|uniref:T9SS type A sorting domain-containing protein n=1 Tax=Mucilaginibacter sp. TaxID=1882438 RepID=UPI003B008EDD
MTGKLQGDVLINGSSTSLNGAGSQVTISASYGGTIKVRANYSGCGVSQFSEQCFTPCSPGPAPLTMIYSNPQTNEPLIAQGQSVYGATSYKWYSDNTLIETTTDPYLETRNWQCGDHNLSCFAVTDCGLSSGAYDSYWGLCSGSYSYRAYPNPTTDYLRISPVQESAQAKANGKRIPPNDFDYILYNNKGKALRSGKSIKAEAMLDVRDLERGTYFLHIKHDKKTDQKQIVIN